MIHLKGVVKWILTFPFKNKKVDYKEKVQLKHSLIYTEHKVTNRRIGTCGFYVFKNVYVCLLESCDICAVCVYVMNYDCFCYVHVNSCAYTLNRNNFSVFSTYKVGYYFFRIAK